MPLTVHLVMISCLIGKNEGKETTPTVFTVAQLLHRHAHT